MKLALITFSLVSLVLTAADPITSAPEYPDHSKLLVYRDEKHQEHPVKTKADWLIRRGHILAGMQQAMGPLPSRDNLPPLDVKILEEVVKDGYKRLTINFAVEGEDRIPAYLYLPDQRPQGKRLPAMLIPHPTGSLGKGIVDGQGKANRGNGPELAVRGYVVLAPDYPSFGDYTKYDFENDRYVSGTMKGIFNHMRCVDLLQSRDEVDPERIGVLGHSLGGHNSMYAAVFDPRLKVIVSSCGWDPFHYYKKGDITGWTSNRYMPLLKTKYGLDPNRVPFDFYEVVAALAPRPFFSNSPLHDSNFDHNGVKKAIAAAQPVYDLLGASQNLKVIYPDSEHDFPVEARREAFDFIDKAFGHTPLRKVP